MRLPATMRWLGLALLGILIAVGVSIAASRLASRQIGLASQPISAGDALAPAAKERPKRHRPGRQSANPRTSTEPSKIPSTPPASSEPAYSPPPSTAPSTPSFEPGRPFSHDGEHSGGSGGGADD
ncbi:MAG TPA: hypothetical protein VFJ64_04960 [Solirubrobacterales bacterium]|nr:hypothetical protein [Solirubrobacterales bacterium]